MSRATFWRAWSAWAVTIAITATAISYDALHPLPAELASQGGNGLDMVVGLTFIVAFATVGALLAWKRPGNPIGIAVLRYRLYDIDRIISRTVAYAIVTGLLVGVYTGLVLLATHVLKVRGPVAVAAATLAAAALFTPVRRWVQSRVDRRFNRVRYDATRSRPPSLRG
ncbi:MAG TPA: hypothetical protein VGD83_09865 [Streptosporangiaceae bacterium]